MTSAEGVIRDRYPILCIFAGRCARVASGPAAVAAPSSVMNLRRIIPLARRRAAGTIPASFRSPRGLPKGGGTTTGVVTLSAGGRGRTAAWGDDRHAHASV